MRSEMREFLEQIGHEAGVARVAHKRGAGAYVEGVADTLANMERFAAVMNCQWLRSSKYGDQVLGWREEFLSRVNAEVAAMQAKEAK